ncbi:MAG: hypothetical protein PHH54_06465 [Candidatus Nanoarchaeia archaeon]|nr:hypothetical protein [Candidatus Nanoarchaeia archaeon]MDD5741599.1 hypothetical protein [Candidatus Nanoarchaeia archaeon]
MEILKNIYNKTREFSKNKLKEHLIESTAMLAESTPLYSIYEKVTGMSHELSINARLLSAGLTYFGLGYIFEKGRESSRKFFNITEKTSEWIQWPHDAVYTGLFSAALAPFVYFLCGSRSTKEIGIGTGCAFALGLVNGYPIGYAIDAFKDLTGLGNCERKTYPNFIKKQPSKIKKAIAVGLVAGSLAVTGGIYSLIPDKEKASVQSSQGIEKMLSSYDVNQKNNLADLMEPKEEGKCQ